MKTSSMFIVLILLAWPLYYLYARQLGAISFLVLALFFFWIAIKELKQVKAEEQAEKRNEKQRDREKIKQNNR